MQHICSEMLIFQRVLKSTSKTHRYLIENSKRYLPPVSPSNLNDPAATRNKILVFLLQHQQVSHLGISPIGFMAHRYLSSVSITGSSHRLSLIHI